MEHNIWITIPTYYGINSTDNDPADTEFDHPTSIDSEGTLIRCLENLRKVKAKFTLLLITAVSHSRYMESAHKKVESIIGQFLDDFEIFHISPVNLPKLNSVLNKPLLSLTGYGNIRNVQIVIPYIMGATMTIGIDDDEIVEDPLYLGKAIRFLNKEYSGKQVYGMAGPYYDINGDYKFANTEELASNSNIFIKKNYFMNEALKKVMDHDKPLIKSNVAFGGNMCFSRKLVRSVCHDPAIPRGEDYDYVINAAMKNIFFYFQKKMAIVHLPPDSNSAQAGDNYRKLIADIKRFIYFRSKLKYHTEKFPEEAISLEYLMPYPGAFLEQGIDLFKHGVEALKTLYPDFCQLHSPEEIVANAVIQAKINTPKFFEYREEWETMMCFIDKNIAVLKELAQSAFYSTTIIITL